VIRPVSAFGLFLPRLLFLIRLSPLGEQQQPAFTRRQPVDCRRPGKPVAVLVERCGGLCLAGDLGDVYPFP
jgi:hypothetical protein